MNKTSIHRLTQSKYKEGARLGLMNAKNHLLVSLESAKIGQFGIAKGLLVLATEELAKASVLKIKSISNLIVIHNLEDYFTNHQTKHESIIGLFIASCDTLNNDVNNNDAKRHNIKESVNKPNDYIWIIGLFVLIVIGYFIFCTNDSDKTDKQKIKSKSDFDEIKESGFYLGYDQNNVKWLYPNNIHDKIDYEELKTIVDMGLGVIESTLFNDKINKNNIIEYSKKLEDENIFPKRIRSYRSKINISEEQGLEPSGN